MRTKPQAKTEINLNPHSAPAEIGSIPIRILPEPDDIPLWDSLEKLNWRTRAQAAVKYIQAALSYEAESATARIFLDESLRQIAFSKVAIDQQITS